MSTLFICLIKLHKKVFYLLLIYNMRMPFSSTLKKQNVVKIKTVKNVNVPWIKNVKSFCIYNENKVTNLGKIRLVSPTSGALNAGGVG